jgi:hypothetical protein
MTARVAAAALLAAVSLGWPTSTAGASSSFPVGTPNRFEPSSFAPPGATALAGYRLTYVNDFNDGRIPSGWNLFSGHPGGISAAVFSPHHVNVAQGLLRLKTYQDPAYHGHWTTGGICQCQRAVKYGAFFVRSRITGAGANSVELLWPWRNASWPPEIDFNENLNHLGLTTSTTHWGTVNHISVDILRIDMLKWHTWGVIWTPTYVLYVVDGHPWHEFSVANEVPQIPLTLDFEQRALCPSTNECPTQPSAMLVDWVAEYAPRASGT